MKYGSPEDSPKHISPHESGFGDGSPAPALPEIHITHEDVALVIVALALGGTLCQACNMLLTIAAKTAPSGFPNP